MLAERLAKSAVFQHGSSEEHLLAVPNEIETSDGTSVIARPRKVDIYAGVLMPTLPISQLTPGSLCQPEDFPWGDHRACDRPSGGPCQERGKRWPRSPRQRPDDQ